MMLLFVYVLGGAIQTGTGSYVNYLLPGILLIAIGPGLHLLLYYGFQFINIFMIHVCTKVMYYYFVDKFHLNNSTSVFEPKC